MKAQVVNNFDSPFKKFEFFSHYLLGSVLRSITMTANAVTLNTDGDRTFRRQDSNPLASAAGSSHRRTQLSESMPASLITVRDHNHHHHLSISTGARFLRSGPALPPAPREADHGRRCPAPRCGKDPLLFPHWNPHRYPFHTHLVPTVPPFEARVNQPAPAVN